MHVFDFSCMANNLTGVCQMVNNTAEGMCVVCFIGGQLIVKHIAYLAICHFHSHYCVIMIYVYLCFYK